MNTIRETFHKSERLCSRKIIGMLFENGNIFYSSLLKVVWSQSHNTLPFPAQVTFSVSKRGFRLAVTRNLIKRRLREAYRKNKRMLYEHLIAENIQITFVVIIRGNSVPDYSDIEKSVKEMINKLMVLTSRKSEVGGQKSEVRSPKSENGSQKPEDSFPKPEVRSRKPED
jgi:ribonuclease P protein component